ARATDGDLGAMTDGLRWRDWALLLACTVIAAALLLTHSRAGVAATAAALLLLCWLMVRRGGLDARLMWLALAVLAAGAGAGLALAGGGVAARLTDEGVLVTENQRWILWQQTLALIGERPWLGHGLGAYG